MSLERLEGALRRRFERDGGVPFVGGDASSLVIDLSGARLKDDAPPPTPVDVGEEFRAALLSVRGEPVIVRGAEVRFRLDAADAAFVVAEDGSSAAPRTIGAGQARLELRREALETLLLAALREKARAQGATVERVELSLAAAGPRGVRVDATVGVKMMFRAAVDLTAELAVQDDLSATIVDFHARAGGMLGGMLGGMMDNLAAKVRGKKIALAGAPLAGARVKDVRVDVHDGLTLEADLGP